MNTDELPFTVGTGGTMAASIFIVISVVLAWFVLKRARIL